MLINKLQLGSDVRYDVWGWFQVIVLVNEKVKKISLRLKNADVHKLYQTGNVWYFKVGYGQRGWLT